MCGITCAVCPRREEEGSTTLRKDCSSYSKGSARAPVLAAQRFLALRVVEVNKPPVGFNKSREFGLELRCYVPAVVFALVHLIPLRCEVDLTVTDFQCP